MLEGLAFSLSNPFAADFARSDAKLVNHTPADLTLLWPARKQSFDNFLAGLPKSKPKKLQKMRPTLQ